MIIITQIEAKVIWKAPPKIGRVINFDSSWNSSIKDEMKTMLVRDFFVKWTSGPDHSKSKSIDASGADYIIKLERHFK